MSAPSLGLAAEAGDLRKTVGQVVDSLMRAPHSSDSGQTAPALRQSGPSAPTQPTAPAAPEVKPLGSFPQNETPLPGSAFARRPAAAQPGKAPTAGAPRRESAQPAQQPAQQPDEVLRLTHDGQERVALLYAPKSAAHRLPVLLFLHGAAGSARQAVRQTGLAARAVRAGFLAVFPEGLATPQGLENAGAQTWNAWNCCGYARDQKIDDVGFLAALIERLKAEHSADPRRVYLVGFSNGAMLASRFALERPGVAAAIASVAGSVPCDVGPPREPLPVLVIHGNHDRMARFGPLPGQPRSGRFCEDFPAKAQVDFWVAGMGLPARPSHVRDGRKLRTRIELYGPGGRSGRALVEYVIVKGGGHAWPGGACERYRYCDQPTPDPDATALVLDFFQRQAKGATPEKAQPAKAPRPKKQGKTKRS